MHALQSVRLHCWLLTVSIFILCYEKTTPELLPSKAATQTMRGTWGQMFLWYFILLSRGRIWKNSHWIWPITTLCLDSKLGLETQVLLAVGMIESFDTSVLTSMLWMPLGTNLLLFKHANSDLDSNLAYFLNQLQLAHTIFCHSSLSTVTYYKKGLIVQDFSSPRRGHHALLRAWLVVLKKAENLNWFWIIAVVNEIWIREYYPFSAARRRARNHQSHN